MQCASVFDPHDTQRLTQEDMREAMVKLYHDRKHLALSLADLDSMCVIGTDGVVGGYL